MYDTNIIHAACILHNVCQHDSTDDDDIEPADVDDDDDDGPTIASNPSDEPAKSKRQHIAELSML